MTKYGIALLLAILAVGCAESSNQAVNTVDAVPDEFFVRYTVPEDGADTVGLDQDVMVAFSMPLDCPAFDPANVYLIDDDSDQVVTAEIQCASNTVRLMPGSALLPGTRYAIVVDAGIANTTGAVLLASAVYGFKTVVDPEAETTVVEEVYGPTALGILDPAFGYSYVSDATKDGYVLYKGPNHDTGSDIIVDGQGRILVAGFRRTPSDYDLAVWRFLADGTTDTTFGYDYDGSGNPDGYVKFEGPGGHDFGEGGIALDSTGRILVAGHARMLDGSYDTVLLRFSANGLTDTTFGGDYDAVPGPDGYVFADYNPGRTEEARAMRLDAAGRILVAGRGTGSSFYEAYLMRFAASGTLDTAFGGGDGIVIYDQLFGSAGDSGAYDLRVLPDGDLLLAGYADDGAGVERAVVWKASSSGAIHTWFGQNGVAVFGSSSGKSKAEEIVVDSANRIVLTGYAVTQASMEEDMLLARFTPTGQTDTTFGSNGWLVHQIAAGTGKIDIGRGVVQDAAGNYVVAGMSERAGLASMDMTVWRFLPDGTLDTSFGAGVDSAQAPSGYTTFHNTGGGDKQDQGYGVALDANGNILVTGWVDSAPGGTGADMAVWRLK